MDCCIIRFQKTETHIKKSVYIQIAKVAVTLIVLITMIGLFIGLSEDSDSQGQVLQPSQVNLTENPITTTIASTTGKFTLQFTPPFLLKITKSLTRN